MEGHKYIEDMPLETMSPPLRRKSVFMQNTSTPILTENNDEAERVALHNEKNAATIPINNRNINNNKGRKSLGLSFLAQRSAPEITQHISDCIKLNNENKINAKNAFNLEMIDFMTYMISKKDTNMTNLQVASTSLDVSAKIYGFRVDSVHNEIMKLSGGLDKHEDEYLGNGTEVHNNGQENEADDLHRLEKKKKKKRNNQNIFGTVNSLRGIIETTKPSLWIREDHDVQTTNALYQAILPNHANSKFYLHSYNDITVDTIEHRINNEYIKEFIPKILDFSKSEICPHMVGFKFLHWSTSDEVEENDNVQSQENNENRFQFDLDASLPSEDEVFQNDINYSHTQDEVETVEKCVEAQRTEAKIVDLCEVVSNCVVTKPSEYTFLQRNINIHWAGPSHWKINNFMNLTNRSNVVQKCNQEPKRRKNEIEIKYDDKTKESITAKFTKAKTNTKLEASKSEWSEERITLPVDVHYNISHTTKLYLYKLIELNAKTNRQLNTADISYTDDYDYNNENDTSNYCPRVPNTDYETSENNGNENECDVVTETLPETQAFVEDNLVAAPKLTNKISIAYSTQAKRIDMRQLKKAIWSGLSTKTNNLAVEDANTQNTVEEENKIHENKEFNKIYKSLPTMLTKTNAEALSFPVAFVSLLHLANEKTLKLQTLPDMSEIIIEPN